MGGASEPFRLLTLGVALWCALAPSCSEGGGSTSTTQGDPRGIAGERAPATAAGDGPELAGAGASGPEPDSPEGTEGGTAAAPKQPSADPAPEDTAGGANGGAPSVTLDGEGGGESEAGGAAAAAPTCGKQADGTLCGPNMTPAGPEGARYFCSDGVVVAEAACPGPCDVETNTCTQSGGTGGGMGETSFHTLLHCRACYATSCREQLVQCEADPYCVAHLECVETCTASRACYSTCTKVFVDEPLLDELNGCVDLTGCADKCPTE